MPTTRRKRANSAEQPENTHLETQQAEVTAEAGLAEQQAAHEPQAAPTGVNPDASTSSSEVNTENSSQPSAAPSIPTLPTNAPPSVPAQAQVPSQASQVSQPQLPTAAMNGASEHVERNEQEAYPSPSAASPAPTTPHQIEGGRRTPRGELFRRPPQPPLSAPVQQAPVSSTVSMQAPTHEITLPLGRRPGDTHGDPLHLAYNPGYTGSDEARSLLLHKLAQESKSGGRARCWNCGSIAIVYDRWNTRSKTFGEIGIAMCEICGVWSVM